MIHLFAIIFTIIMASLMLLLGSVGISIVLTILIFLVLTKLVLDFTKY